MRNEVLTNPWQSLVSVVNAGILVVDFDGVIHFVNAEAERLFGRPAKRMIGETFTFPISTKSNQEIEIVRPDYQVFVAEMQASVGTWEDEEVWIISLHDLTKRRAYEEQMRRVRDELIVSNNRLRTLAEVIENSFEGVMITDAEEHIVFVNNAFTEITGYTKEDVLGKTPRVLSSGRLEKEFYQKMWHEIERTGSWRGEFWNRRKNGDIFPEFATINAIHDSQGNVLNYSAFFSDASKIKQQSEELRKINAELEQFAYVTSHDLREPLRTISSFLGLLERRLGPDLEGDAKEYLNFAVDGARRMDLLIQDILTFSRIGRTSAEAGRIDMNLAMDTVTAQLNALIVAAQAEVATDNTLPAVMANHVDIERLLGNLLSNAIKYRHPDRRLVVTVSGTSDRNLALFTFADTGIGIEPKFQERVFRIFQRLHTSDHQQYGGGTGVGLSICRKIVESFGGRIWIDSTPGEGSKFHFTLPLAD